jgi:hypothetical protein
MRWRGFLLPKKAAKPAFQTLSDESHKRFSEAGTHTDPSGRDEGSARSETAQRASFSLERLAHLTTQFSR